MTIDRQDQRASGRPTLPDAHGIEGLVSPDELCFVLQLQLVQLSSLSLLQHCRRRAQCTRTYNLHVITTFTLARILLLYRYAPNISLLQNPAQQLTSPCHPGQAAKNIPSCTQTRSNQATLLRNGRREWTWGTASPSLRISGGVSSGYGQRLCS